MSNIFNINRLGIDDTESGNSLTFGVDYKKTKKDNTKNILNINLQLYLEMKMNQICHHKHH